MSRARFSEALANRRRQLGLTIPQAARVLRLRADVLEAFESGDFANMPTSGYAQGMLSSYARYLGLNATDVVDMFNEELETYRRRNPDFSSEDSEAAHRAETGGRSYPQGRPYTGRAPYDARSRERRQAAARRNALRRGERAYAENGGYEYDHYDAGSGNISTMRVDEGRYEDDLGFSNNAQPYRAASTPEGRTYPRDYSSTERPNVQRRQPSSTHRRVRTTTRSSRNSGRRQGKIARFFDDPVHAFGTIAIAVVLVLTLVIIGSVTSCVSNALDDGSKSVTVSSSSNDSSDSSSSGSGSSSSQPTAAEQEEDALGQLAAVDSSTTDTSAETNVTVSVADGAVTWLEVENDGQSDVADTITGPWERTYTVTDSITIQAHDTSSVTVTRNGKQVQFDTLAGGVGTVTIKGTQPNADTSQSSDGEGSSSSSGEGSTQASGQSATSSGAQASGTSSANAGTASGSAGSSSGTSAGAGAGSSSTTASGSTATGTTSSTRGGAS